MYRPLSTRTTRMVLAALAAAGLTVAGCGSDDKAATTTAAPPTAPATSAAATTGAATSTTAAKPTTTTGKPATTSAAATTAAHHDSAPATAAGAAQPAGLASPAYCSAAMSINVAANAGGDPSEDPVAFAGTLLAPAKAAAALAPAEVAGTYATALTALQATVDGDPSQLDAVQQAGGAIDEYNVDHCPWTKVPVTMEDYHFTGLPDTLPAGDYVFELTNTGNELHVMVVAARKPGVTASFDELLASPDGESKVDTVVANGAPPGGTATAFGHLEPGDYIVVCPIPQGSDGQTTEGTGPPHFTMGMRQALTVTP